jgi:hypothetical protein
MYIIWSGGTYNEKRTYGLFQNYAWIRNQDANWLDLLGRKHCGHDVHIENKEQFIFRSNNPADDYLIDVLENYKKNTKDHHADHLAQSFVKKTPFL